MTDTQIIKEKIDIVDFIGEYIQLKPAGINHKGLCPFHGEKTPSFMVNRDRQSWHCFGCAKGGDI
ncbi:MAG: DNA primase, partial [Candidatus Magasanikbacteria bacterium CG10_big_fil_rev_8_21_14_0_10_43_6]